MRLVINGDDFGYTKGVCDGIVEGFEKGILRSTTALVNGKEIEYAARLAKEHPNLGVGLHLNLTLGKPLTKNKTLTAEDGNFYKGRKTIWTKDPDYEEIYQEWKAQIEKFIEVFGKLPTHLDSHHSVHDATPSSLEVAKRLANEYNLEMRRYSKFTYVAGFFGESATRETMIELLEAHKDEDVEMMVHPAFCDLDLYRESSYALNRVVELDVLCSKEVRDYVVEHNIILAHY